MVGGQLRSALSVDDGVPSLCSGRDMRQLSTPVVRGLALTYLGSNMDSISYVAYEGSVR